MHVQASCAIPIKALDRKKTWAAARGKQLDRGIRTPACLPSVGKHIQSASIRAIMAG
jgi:hypothetical protein